MKENKCCGNCKHFKDEDVNGFGQCGKDGVITKCNTFCSDYSSRLNGWIEITPDNVDGVDCIDQEKVVIGWLDNKGRQHIAALVDCPPVKSSLAGRGYYYYVLPVLNIE